MVGYAMHTLNAVAKTALSHWKFVESWDLLLKLIRYLGATDEELAEFEPDNKRWGRARGSDTSVCCH
jgi:hypothetical protein